MLCQCTVATLGATWIRTWAFGSEAQRLRTAPLERPEGHLRSRSGLQRISLELTLRLSPSSATPAADPLHRIVAFVVAGPARGTFCRHFSVCTCGCYEPRPRGNTWPTRGVRSCHLRTALTLRSESSEVSLWQIPQLHSFDVSSSIRDRRKRWLPPG